ncbi:ATP-binding protein [Eubacterium sp.]|uniref:ATP-binding protein n=1 Tax=Eubacterium sp. TaxID=142586 RepID=UPI002FCCAA5A
MSAVLKLMETASDLAKRPDPEDYFEKGIRYCGKCHTPKECSVDVGFKVIRVNCLCKCEAEAKEADRERRRIEEALSHERDFKNRCIQDQAMKLWRFESDEEPESKQMRYARRYVSQWEKVYAENIGLCFYGSVGTGKSFAAACIANALVDKHIPAMMTSFSRIMNSMPEIWSGERNEYINSFDRYKLLIIDDLGVERSTDYVLEMIYQIIDARYKNKQPLIITTNLAWRDLKNPEDVKIGRIYDRIVEMCLPVQVEGKSKRVAENQKKREEARLIFEGC